MKVSEVRSGEKEAGDTTTLRDTNTQTHTDTFTKEATDTSVVGDKGALDVSYSTCCCCHNKTQWVLKNKMSPEKKRGKTHEQIK